MDPSAAVDPTSNTNTAATIPAPAATGDSQGYTPMPIVTSSSGLSVPLVSTVGSSDLGAAPLSTAAGSTMTKLSTDGPLVASNGFPTPPPRAHQPLAGRLNISPQLQRHMVWNEWQTGGDGQSYPNGTTSSDPLLILFFFLSFFFRFAC